MFLMQRPRPMPILTKSQELRLEQPELRKPLRKIPNPLRSCSEVVRPVQVVANATFMQSIYDIASELFTPVNYRNLTPSIAKDSSYSSSSESRADYEIIDVQHL